MPGPFPLTPSTGDGSRTVFTSPVLVAGDVLMFIDRIPQLSGSDFTYVVGLTLTTFTFVVAPPPSAVLAFLSSIGTAAVPGTATSTLLAVRTSIRQRADMVTSQFITDAEFNGYINASYFELYDLLVEAYGDDYFSAQPTDPYVLTTDGVTEFYPLPNGTSSFLTPKGNQALAFFKMLAVDLRTDASTWQPLKRFPLGERNRNSMGTTTDVRYRLQGNFIWFRPLPQAAQQIRLLYVPRLTSLVNDTDVIDGVSGWEEYVVVDCVIKAKLKEESDCSTEIGLRDALKLRIQGISENRDAGSPATVADVRGAWDDSYARDGFH